MNLNKFACSFSPGVSMMDQQQSHECGGWQFKSHRSHILNSKCTSSFICKKTRETIGSDLNKSSHSTGTPRKTFDEYVELRNRFLNEKNLCLYCKYDLILSMAHLPDMTYANNYLRLIHCSSLMIEFNALDALAPVLIRPYGLPVGLKVSASEAWLKARMGCEYTKNVCNADFDWTFSTDYCGSFLQNSDEQKYLREDQSPLKELIEPTTERINVAKLTIRKEIKFFEEIELFEDELADHGVAQCSVKIRVHDDSFFILCRFFLRVDRVFVRFLDTRIYHEFDWDYLIREQSHHESTIQDLSLPEDSAHAILIDPQQLFSHVPLKQLKVDKIRLPRKLEK